MPKQKYNKMERFQLNNSLRKLAQHAFQRHSFLKEWRVFILLAIVSKLIAMSFSVFAGYFYLREILQTLFNNKDLTNIISIANLILIEALTAITLFKFFKFALRLNLKAALLPFILALGLFSTSFYFSTNGLALRQSIKIDNHIRVDSLHKLKVREIKEEDNKAKALIDDRINTLIANPLGWAGSKRTHLTSSQLSKIDEYFEDRKDLQDKKLETLAAENAKYSVSLRLNKEKVKSEAHKYYKIAIIIMISIFLVNGLLMLLYSKISEDSKEQTGTENEVLSTFTSEIQAKTSSLIEGRIIDTINLYFGGSEAPIEQKALPVRGSSCKYCDEKLSTDKAFKIFCSDICRQKFWSKVKKR